MVLVVVGGMPGILGFHTPTIRRYLYETTNTTTTTEQTEIGDLPTYIKHCLMIVMRYMYCGVWVLWIIIVCSHRNTVWLLLITWSLYTPVTIFPALFVIFCTTVNRNTDAVFSDQRSFPMTPIRTWCFKFICPSVTLSVGRSKESKRSTKARGNILS